MIAATDVPRAAGESCDECLRANAIQLLRINVARANLALCGDCADELADAIRHKR